MGLPAFTKAGADGIMIHSRKRTRGRYGQLTLIEVTCALGVRADLGRPTTAPRENKAAFMASLEG